MNKFVFAFVCLILICEISPIKAKTTKPNSKNKDAVESEATANAKNKGLAEAPPQRAKAKGLTKKGRVLAQAEAPPKAKDKDLAQAEAPPARAKAKGLTKKGRVLAQAETLPKAKDKDLAQAEAPPPRAKAKGLTKRGRVLAQAEAPPRAKEKDLAKTQAPPRRARAKGLTKRGRSLASNGSAMAIVNADLNKSGTTSAAKDTGGHLNKSEFRAAAFFPMGSKFRKIYGDVGLSLQAEQARTWKNHRNLEIWGNVEWIFMDGSPRRSCGSTDIDILNISLGFKAIGKVFRDILFLYAGIGPDVGIVFLENKMRCHKDRLREHECKIGIGGILKSGGQIYFTSNFYFDVFADYLYLPIHANGGHVDIGGFKVGGGLGIKY